MTNYDDTPSYYNDDKMFEWYLGRTSYYLALQNAIIKITEMINPDNILELGCGLGQTTLRLSEKEKNYNILAIDNREKIIKKANNKTNKPNIVFSCMEMVKCIKNIHKLPKLSIMLYSFHHIEDPLENKISFLENCYNNMDKNSYLCIGEAFTPESDDEVVNLWERRSLEGYASTFWNSLESLDEIKKAQKIGKFAQENEIEAGKNVKNRTDEYLVTKDWLLRESKKIGFDIILSEPCNAFNDYVILLQK